jgi:hypothetical protein
VRVGAVDLLESVCEAMLERVRAELTAWQDLVHQGLFCWLQEVPRRVPLDHWPCGGTQSASTLAPGGFRCIRNRSTKADEVRQSLLTYKFLTQDDIVPLMRCYDELVVHCKYYGLPPAAQS